MKQFLDKDFLLESDTAKKLYHEFASSMPIIDYHCHLSTKDIAQDRIFNNITEAWLEGDHYKWRAMRANGVNETYLTGDKPPREKFRKWAETVPDTFRNPLYHWTHLELQRYFDIHELLSADSADRIYDEASAKLQTPAYSCRQLLKKMNVSMVGTTDDPCDDLKDHKQVKNEGIEIKMLPTFRPDKLYAVENADAYLDYLQKLSGLTGVTINSFGDLLVATQKRVDYFHEVGGRLSDHGLDQLYIDSYSMESAENIFDLVVKKESLSKRQVEIFKMTMIMELSKMYHEKGWTQQFHLGAIRNNNDRMMRTLGPDTGFDSIGDFPQISSLSQFLNQLDSSDQLAQTIIYNLNGTYNDAIATMVGNFNDGTVAGKMQFGTGWWFMDQKEGMENQMNALSNMGLLSRFIGMLTDSRSFLSFPRHEYFRRILCNLIGRDVENGELPNDIRWLGKHVENICFNNAQNYFKLE